MPGVRILLLPIALAMVCGGVRAQNAQANSGAAASQDPETQVFGHPVTGAELRASLLADALGEVERSRVVEGQFAQQRTMRGLPRPLESSGEFLLVRDLGLRWHTLAPVEDEFVLTRAGVSASRPGARRTSLGPATELLFALFSLDLQALERRFELYGLGTPDSWNIGLRPRDKTTARAVREATVRGGRRVESIVLVNGAGDELRIRLHDVLVRPGDLTPEQQALFQ
jgi:hypothetical protein